MLTVSLLGSAGIDSWMCALCDVRLYDSSHNYVFGDHCILSISSLTLNKVISL